MDRKTMRESIPQRGMADPSGRNQVMGRSRRSAKRVDTDDFHRSVENASFLGSGAAAIFWLGEF
jgi:hypothetical protein